MRYYGYDFTKRNQGGLGAIIHDVMNAAKYAADNNLVLGFVKDGYEIPRLNGSYDDTSEPDKNWHSYFTSFEKVDRKDCIEVWPKYIIGRCTTKWDFKLYSDLLKNTVCTFVPSVYDEICELVKKTPFNAKTDIVVHIRLTDKKTETPVFLPLQKYIDECEYALSQLKKEVNRIYVCTDDQTVCEKLQSHFRKKNIEVVWDDTETLEPLQEIRWNGKLKKSIAQEETMNAFKNIFILAFSKYRIGGRMSYFYRVAELLGYPNTTVNIQDNDKYGMAPYSEVNYPIRPYYDKTIFNFLNKNTISDENLEKYREIYNNTRIVTISDFISKEVLRSVRPHLENYKWWTYANVPHNGSWEPNYSETLSDEAIESCDCAYLKKQFTYRFRRCLGQHYDKCTCVSCNLTDTIKSWPFTDTICKITGNRNLRPGEIFLSNYGKGDFLSIHHDKNKGDIAVTISFAYDWDPIYGGVLHFCDKDKNIHTSVTPKAGNINIFKLEKQNGIDHFVSPVVVDRNRYTLTAWYYDTESVQEPEESFKTEEKKIEYPEDKKPKNSIVVVSKHLEDDKWLKQSPLKYVIIDSNEVPHYTYESGKYLNYIIKNYESLPEWCLFMHCHEYTYHHISSHIDSMHIDTNELDKMSIEFLNINHGKHGRMLMNNYRFVMCKELTQQQMIKLRKGLLNLDTHIEMKPEYFCYPSNAQFWVKRNRILKHPKSFYENIYNSLINKELYPELHIKSEWNKDAPMAGFFLEMHWHYILGEKEYYKLPFNNYADIPKVNF